LRGRYAGLVARTIAITPSGALSPGPLSASAIAVGAALGAAGGLAVAVGHTLFELPYVALLARWAGRVRGLLAGGWGRLLLGFMAGFTWFFALGLARLALQAWGAAALPGGGGGPLAPGGLAGAVLVGVFYTGANPYFLAWWATAGFPLLEEASMLPAGLPVMYTAHVWMDYAWLGLLAAGGGAAVAAGHRAYAALMGALSIVLGYYALTFTLRALRPQSRGRGPESPQA
jgi:threonine/homoserine/homoserine lactone efflux protein